MMMRVLHVALRGLRNDFIPSENNHKMILEELALVLNMNINLGIRKEKETLNIKQDVIDIKKEYLSIILMEKDKSWEVILGSKYKSEYKESSM